VLISQLLGVRLLLGVYRLEQETDVIAERNALEHGAREPALAVVEDRRAVRVVPADARELVDLVAGLTTEDLGDPPVVRLDEMHGEDRCRARDAESVIFLRDAGQETRRVDAALRAEADEAAGRLAADRRRHDVQRIVECCNELLKR